MGSVCAHVCDFVLQEFVNGMLMKAKFLCAGVCICECMSHLNYTKSLKKNQNNPRFEDTYLS